MWREPVVRGAGGEGWVCYAEPEVVLSNVELQGSTWFGFASYMNQGLVRGYVEVGRYCSIGRGVTLGMGSHAPEHSTTSPFFRFDELAPPRIFVQQRPQRRTIIGNDVWIGDGALIGSGIRVGDGAIIGAGAVVVKDVEPYQIVGGVPARVIRERFNSATINGLVDSNWWRIDPEVLKSTISANPQTFLDALEKLPSDVAKLPPSHRTIFAVKTPSRIESSGRRRSDISKLLRKLQLPYFGNYDKENQDR